MFNDIVDQRAPYQLASIKEAVVNQTFVNEQTKKCLYAKIFTIK